MRSNVSYSFEQNNEMPRPAGIHRSTGSSAPALTPLAQAKAIERARRLLQPEDDHSQDTFPIEKLGALSEAAQAIATGAQVQPTMAAHAVLGTAALLTQRTANILALDGNVKPLSLYLLTVAESGDGKDSADRPALNAVHNWQRERGNIYEMRLRDYQTGRTGTGESAELPRSPYLIASDITIEGVHRSFREGEPAQGVFSTEAGQILAGHAMSSEQRTKTAANLCSFFDSGRLSVARAGNGRTERYGVRLSAHMMIQPAALGDVLSDDGLTGIGFWPRFLLGWPPSLPPRRFKVWRANEDPALGAYWHRCSELLAHEVPDNCDSLPTIELTEDARNWLGIIFEDLETQGRRGALREIKPFALRGSELICRVAGVIAAWDNRKKVGLKGVQDAACVVMHSLNSWQTALTADADPAPGWALTLYRWLVQRGAAVPIRDLTKLAPSRVRAAARRNRAVDLLREQGLVAVEGGMISALGVQNYSE